MDNSTNTFAIAEIAQTKPVQPHTYASTRGGISYLVEPLNEGRLSIGSEIFF